MKVVDIIAFENINAIDQPILPISFLKLSLRQLGLLMITVFTAYGISSRSIELAVFIALLLLAITFYRPYNMPFEVILLNIFKFIHRRITEGKGNGRKKDKDEDTIKKEQIQSIQSKPKTLYNGMIFKKKDKKELDITNQSTATTVDTTPTPAITASIPTMLTTSTISDAILYYIVPDYKTVSINTDSCMIESDNTKIVLPSRKDMHIEIVVEDGTIRKIVVH